MAKSKAKVGRPTNKEVSNRQSLKLSTVAMKIALVAAVISIVVILINHFNLVK